MQGLAVVVETIVKGLLRKRGVHLPSLLGLPYAVAFSESCACVM